MRKILVVIMLLGTTLVSGCVAGPYYPPRYSHPPIYRAPDWDFEPRDSWSKRREREENRGFQDWINCNTGERNGHKSRCKDLNNRFGEFPKSRHERDGRRDRLDVRPPPLQIPVPPPVPQQSPRQPHVQPPLHIPPPPRVPGR